MHEVGAAVRGSTVTSPIGWPGVLGEWTLTPVTDALLLLAAVAYLSAARRRRRWHGTRWPPWRTACALSGLVVIVLALNSVVGVYGRELHSVHMVQHLALITVAPVLLALGHPLTLARESSAHGQEVIDLLRHNRFIAISTHPLVAFAGYAAVLVGTHLTGFMALVAAHPWLHEVELAVCLISGCLFALSLLALASVEQGLAEYERIFRPVAEEKQRVAVKAVRWFLPHTRPQLLVRRAALTLARIPVFTRYVAGAVTGKTAGLVQASKQEAA